MKGILQGIYGNGLEGRSVLDCACNCGVFAFAARELGAGDCVGFDAREHWIRQARFLNDVWDAGITFEVGHVYEVLPKLPQFDVVLFESIFYHLPDPILGLKLAAERCRETLLLSTKTIEGRPDGALVSTHKDVNDPIKGVDGLAWYPSGPKALSRILDWLGFSVEVLTWDFVPAMPRHLKNLRLVARR
jgi:tRNA (mo5U34)-methyltransferase